MLHKKEKNKQKQKNTPNTHTQSPNVSRRAILIPSVFRSPLATTKLAQNAVAIDLWWQTTHLLFNL